MNYVYTRKYKHIYDRYIDDDAEYCINLSFLVRRKFKKLIMSELGYESVGRVTEIALNSFSVDEIEGNNESMASLMHLMDEAVAEINSLLSFDCFIRFTQTEQFQQLFNK